MADWTSASGPFFAAGITASVVLFSAAVSWYARRFARTTLEFYLAGRTVGLFTNASAICGDYFSAASFLGVAGAVYAWGLDGMWFGTGYAAGFVPLLLFFASPLRRFGEYTLPDFLQARFNSQAARLLGTVIVLLATTLYLVPQAMGVGTIWRLIAGQGIGSLDAYSTGVLMTAAVMVIYSAVGGMRGTTWNQAIQFWILFGAIVSVLGLAAASGFHYSRAVGELRDQVLLTAQPWRVGDLLQVDPQTGQAPVQRAREVMSPDYWERHVAPYLDDPEARVVVLMPRRSRLEPQTPVTFARPGALYGPLDQLSLFLSLVLGTSGLPHLIMRYYTHPSGRVARWSTVGVLVLTFAFYSVAVAVGVAGRALVPALAERSASGEPTFAVADGVLVSADMVLPFLAQSLGGPAYLGVVVAGAIAAMLSTFGGLLMVGAASIGHDLFEQFIWPQAPETVKVQAGRLAVILMAAVSALLGLAARHVASAPPYPALIAMLVLWAFSLVASGLVPGLFLAIWWRGTTLAGFVCGVGLGTLLAMAFLAANLAELTGRTLVPGLGMGALRLTLPTLLCAPVALLTTLGVSLLGSRHTPAYLEALWVRIHGTAQERRLAAVGAAGRGRRRWLERPS